MITIYFSKHVATSGIQSFKPIEQTFFVEQKIQPAIEGLECDNSTLDSLDRVLHAA